MTDFRSGRDDADVVVVGTRVAGAPLAAELARAGRRVIALDAASFPSDTVSTHVIWPGTVAELSELGVLEPLLTGGSPKMFGIHVEQGGHVADGRFSPVDGIEYGLCPRRTTLDHLLVARARALGVEVRESTRVIDLLWDGERVCGVVVREPDGTSGRIRARLVVGADGRRSTVARLVGQDAPHRSHANGRGLVFGYVEDPAGDADRHTLSQWRIGDTLSNYFPTDDGTAVALFMGPKSDVSRYGQDLRYWNEMVARSPQLRDRIGTGRLISRLRKTADTVSYFRRSTGPGWALVGDAGHFKDPVIAQGIRDAVHYGRTLARITDRWLDHDPAVLDKHLRRWEIGRDRECTPSYYWGERLTRADPVRQIETQAFSDLERSPELADGLADVFARHLRPRQLTSIRRLSVWGARALGRPGADRGAVLREARAEFRFDLAEARDLAALAGSQLISGGRT